MTRITCAIIPTSSQSVYVPLVGRYQNKLFDWELGKVQKVKTFPPFSYIKTGLGIGLSSGEFSSILSTRKRLATHSLTKSSDNLHSRHVSSRLLVHPEDECNNHRGQRDYQQTLRSRLFYLPRHFHRQTRIARNISNLRVCKRHGRMEVRSRIG